MINLWFFLVYVSTDILCWLIVKLRKDLKLINKKRILIQKIRLNKKELIKKW